MQVNAELAMQQTGHDSSLYLDVRNLVKIFGSERAVDNISFGVKKGEFITLLGPSGCGKTTTLMCIAGLHRPEGGAIWLDNECVTSVADGIFLPPERRGIGMVFQSYAIWPHMTVAQNVAYPLEVQRVPKAERQERVQAALRRVQLLDFINRPATNLSGGQQQRVAIARAIVFNPRLLLFDEPLSNLDAKLREEMRVELKRLQETLGITSVYVTHDQAEALVLSDCIITMSKGLIEQQGDPRTIYAQPANRFVSQFIGIANLLSGTVTEVDGEWRTVEIRNDTAAHRFRCRASDDVSPGDPVDVSIRPEHVQIITEAPPGADCNTIEGDVVSSIFLGNYIDCRVQCGTVEWKVQVRRRQRLRPGMRVWLMVQPQHCLCLPK
jgi:iron(III) transport system ATP-binding protein